MSTSYSELIVYSASVDVNLISVTVTRTETPFTSCGRGQVFIIVATIIVPGNMWISVLLLSLR